MIPIFIGLVAFLLLLAVIFKVGKIRRKGQAEFPYRRRKAIFTSSESSFYNVLDQAVGEHAHIFGKVRMANVVSPNKGMTASQWKGALFNIADQHFDFLLCDKRSHTVLCAIDFNGHPAESVKRQAHDAFMKGVCESVKIPLVHVQSGETYSVEDMQNLMASHLPRLRNSRLFSGNSDHQNKIVESINTLVSSEISA